MHITGDTSIRNGYHWGLNSRQKLLALRFAERNCFRNLLRVINLLRISCFEPEFLSFVLKGAYAQKIRCSKLRINVEQFPGSDALSNITVMI